MIPVTYLRSSAYGAHEFCGMRYFAEYTLGWAGKSNKAADKGTIVHKVMEILAGSKMAQQDNQPYYDDDILGQVSSDVMSLDTVDITHKIYHYYISKFTHHNWKRADYTDCQRWVRKVFEQKNGIFDPRKRDIVAQERRFDIGFTEDWAKYDYDINGEKISGHFAIKGTIDLITKINDTTYEIIDWKTGQCKNWGTGQKKTYADLMKDAQLRLYYYAVSKLYPNVDLIMLTINYMNDGGPRTLMYQKKDIPETIEMLKSKFEEIKRTQQPLLNIGEKCRAFCSTGKTTFEGTHVKPIVQKGYGHVTRPGQYMSKCEQLQFTLQHRPIETVIEHMTAPGHHLGHYKAPGSA